MIRSKKCNLLFRVTALLMACFIVIGMSGIQTMAESGGSEDSTVVTGDNTKDDQNQGNENGSGKENSSNTGSTVENSASADSADSDSSEGKTGDSATDSASSAQGTTEGASDASTESSSEEAAATASTSDTPQVLSDHRVNSDVSLVISEGKISFADAAQENSDYRWESDNTLRTRDTVSITVKVEYVKKGNNTTDPGKTTEKWDAIGASVKIEYKNIKNGRTEYGTMKSAGEGYYTYTFPDTIATYEVVKIYTEDRRVSNGEYTKENAQNAQKENNIFRKISVEKDHYADPDGKGVNDVTNYNRILSVGSSRTSALYDDPWISLQGEDSTDATLTIKFSTFLKTDENKLSFSLVPVDDKGNEISGDVIKGSLVKAEYTCPTTEFEVEFKFNAKQDQYTIYKIVSEGDRYVSAYARYINRKFGYVYVKIDSTSPVANNIKVVCKENNNEDANAANSYVFGGSEKKVIYSENDMILSVDTSSSYDPDINEADKTDENDRIPASGLCQLTYLIYDDSSPNGRQGKVSICDKDIDECGNIEIKLPEMSQGQGPVRIGSVALVDGAGNITYVKGNKNSNSEDRIENVSFVIDKIAPVITFTELNGEALGENYAQDLESTPYFFTDNVSGNLEIDERYLDPQTVHLSSLDGHMVPGISVPNDPSTELGAKTVCTFTTSGEGIYYFSAQASDKCKHTSEIVNSPLFVVDSTAPVITVTYTSGGATVTPEGKDKSYYNNSVVVKISINDLFMTQDGIEAVITGTQADGTAVNMSVSGWNHDAGSDSWTAEVELSVDGEYALKVGATDKAGNVSDPYTGAGFTIDCTIPTVSITFDNNSPQNEIYYNASRTATITVKDYTFDSSKCELTMNAPDNSPSIGDWTSAGDQTYVQKVAFTSDGRYDFSFKTTDKAGNESQTHTISLFIIDTTAPVVTVTYDNNDAKNTYYYNASRKATIKIDEISFDETLVDIRSQASSDGTAMAAIPKAAAFASNETNNVYTSSMSFANDGKYGYTITVTDLAGNKSEVYTSDIFVIDTTAPDITFSGVENYSANNGVVAPVLIYKDLNVDLSKSTVVMEGANHGVVTPDSKQSTASDTVTITYSDFAHDKDTDDLYTLSVKITDLAGNVSEEELVFSVNRHGSVYVIDNDTKELTQQYYTSEPEDVIITEINVDSLTYKEVSVDRDGDSEVLKEGRDYTVSVQGDDKSWKSMTYTVKASNFKKDGNYSVMVYSKDRATNTQDNRSADKEIEFAVDKTAPSIVTSGIEEEGIYEEDGHDIIINVSDNMGFESLVIYVGQDELKELVSYTDEDIVNQGGTLTISLPELDKYQNVMILATDVAGNKSERDFNNVLVSRNARKIIESGDTPKNDEIKPSVEPDSNPFKIWVAVAGAFVGVSGIAGAGVFFWRKKNSAEAKSK